MYTQFVYDTSFPKNNFKSSQGNLPEGDTSMGFLCTDHNLYEIPCVVP